MSRTAVRRRSWKSFPETPAALHAAVHARKKLPSGFPSRWKMYADSPDSPGRHSYSRAAHRRSSCLRWVLLGGGGLGDPLASGAKGPAFESRRAHQIFQSLTAGSLFWLRTPCQFRVSSRENGATLVSAVCSSRCASVARRAARLSLSEEMSYLMKTETVRCLEIAIATDCERRRAPCLERQCYRLSGGGLP